ncbi:BQ2448_137 [Microbotryum intermedium]|uniref:BQ2448_137 protein n=1 Tax=Microbotryum intermedium TaxID=269621 RepID=A0A238FAA2_9BASI|nr:BQ2448_137 [Microbotryum intermedium]
MSTATPFEFLSVLRAWLHPNLVIRPAVLLGDTHVIEDEDTIQAAGVSVQSRGTINIGDTVARIPKRCVLSHRNSHLSIPKWDSSFELSPTLRLVLIVLYEIERGPQSKWYGYLESLPLETVPVGVLWTGEAKRWARGSEVERVVNGLGLDQASLEMWWISLPSELLDSIGNPSREIFFRTYSLVSSRAFMVDAYHTVALVPLFDLFNHSDTPHVHAEAEHWVCSTCGSFEECPHDDEMDTESEDKPRLSSSPTSDAVVADETETYELVSLLPIEPNEEIFNTYGDFGNAQLVAMYGFLIDGNQFDRIHFDLVSEIRLGEEQREELEDLRSIWLDMGPRAHDHHEHDLITPLVNSDLTPQQLRSHNDYYIDAEARLSTPLWLAILVASEIPLPRSTRKKKEDFLQCFFKALSNLETGAALPPLEERDLFLFKIQTGMIVLRKLELQHRPELTSRDLLELAEAQDLEEMDRLAMRSLATERDLLETLVAKISDAP